MKTFQERLIAGLHRRGFIEYQSGSKYRSFTKDGSTFFVGSRGALRTGRNASNSISVGEPSNQNKFYVELLVDGDVQLQRKKEMGIV